MIWLTWRQVRVQTLAIYAGLLVVAAMLAATAAHVAELERLSEDFALVFEDDFASTLYPLAMVVMLVVPAIIGAFWGAPLVSRELEAGTHRLVWNQTVTRNRWLAVKLGGTLLIALAGVAVVSALLTWWTGPLNTAILEGRGGNNVGGVSRVEPWIFPTRGLVPVAYTAFAFALGVATGMVLRRAVAAMAITLAIYLAFVIAMPMFVRPHLGPVTKTETITAENFRGLRGEVGPGGTNPRVDEVVVDIRPLGAWETKAGTMDPRTGEIASPLPAWVSGCLPPPPARGSGPERAPVAPGGKPGPDAGCLARLEREGYKAQITYQPMSRFWTLQAIEAGIFGGLAVLLTGFSFFWLRRLS